MELSVQLMGPQLHFFFPRRKCLGSLCLTYFTIYMKHLIYFICSEDITNILCLSQPKCGICLYSNGCNKGAVISVWKIKTYWLMFCDPKESYSYIKFNDWMLYTGRLKVRLKERFEILGHTLRWLPTPFLSPPRFILPPQVEYAARCSASRWTTDGTLGHIMLHRFSLSSTNGLECRCGLKGVGGCNQCSLNAHNVDVLVSVFWPFMPKHHILVSNSHFEK